MMITNDYQSFNKEAAAARRAGTDLEAPGQLKWTPLTFQTPIFKHAMTLIEDPLSPDVQSRIEQMGIRNIHDLALLHESDVYKIFPDDNDVLKRRRLGKVIKVLQLQLAPPGHMTFFITDNMVTIEDRIYQYDVAKENKW